MFVEGVRSISPLPKGTSKHGECSSGNTADRLIVSDRPKGFLLEDLLGNELCHRISELPNVACRVEFALSESVLATAINGGVQIVVNKLQTTGDAVRASETSEEVKSLSLYRLNDELVDVVARSGMGTTFSGRLQSSSVYGVDSAQLMGMLIEYLAEQPYNSWRFLLSKLVVPMSVIPDGQSFGLVKLWDNEFPPLDDTIGVRMYEEAALLHRWITAGESVPVRQPHVKYTGPGSVEIMYPVTGSSPGLRFVFESDLLREFAVTKAPWFMSVGPQEQDLFLPFYSDTFRIGTRDYWEFLDHVSVALASAKGGDLHRHKRLQSVEVIRQIVEVAACHMRR
jgi:hypothetical protein